MPSSKSQKIANAIRRQISSSLGAQISPGFVVIRAPSGFPYSIQYGAAAYWNPKTLNLVDQLCKAPGDGTGEMTGARFSTTYADILAASDYVTSKRDTACQQHRRYDFNSATQTLITQFETQFGQIDQSAIKAIGSVPPTKAQYISDYVSKKFKGDPPDFPPSMAAFAGAWSDWTQLGEEITRTTTLKAEALKLLRMGESHVRNPAAGNGALRIGASDWAPAYDGLPDNATIQADLSDADRATTVEVTLKNKGRKIFALTVAEQPLDNIPATALSLALVHPDTGKAKSMDSLWQSASKVEMDIVYTGLSIVSCRPSELSADANAGWFSRAALSQIATKTGKDVTGLQLDGSTYSPERLFGQGKTFARVKTFIISQEPTITLRFFGTGQSQFPKQLKRGAKAQVHVPGIGCFGGNSAQYTVQSAGEDGNVVTVVIAPSTTPVTIPPEDRTAHIIGGIVEYPP